MGVKFRDTCTDEECDSDDLPVQVCSSAAGYYIGQLELCGAPFSRLSGYFKKREQAEQALKEGWDDRGAEENKEVVKGLEDKMAIRRMAKTSRFGETKRGN